MHGHLGAEELEFCRGCAESEEPVGPPGGDVQEEEEYKGLSPDCGGQEESPAKNVGDVAPKPGEDGVPESPGRGRSNCKLRCTPHQHTHTLNIQRLVLEFGESHIPPIMVQSSYD